MRTRNTQLMWLDELLRAGPWGIHDEQHTHGHTPLEHNLLRGRDAQCLASSTAPHMWALFLSHWADSAGSCSKRPEWLPVLGWEWVAFAILAFAADDVHIGVSPLLCLTFLFFLIDLCWIKIASQYCVSFSCTTKWISHMHTYIPSLLSLPPTLPIPPL